MDLTAFIHTRRPDWKRLEDLLERVETSGLGTLDEDEAVDFGQLYRRCGWPVWLAILPTALLFGWGHVEQGGNFREAAALFLLLSSGGVFFAWFYYRWNSLWFPWIVHALMNFYWEIFSVSRSALGGWFPFALQWITILTATLLTWKVTRKQSSMQTSV